MTSVVISAGAVGSRALVRTADSVARQTSPADVILAVSGVGPSAGVIASLVSRLRAVEVRAETDSAALNEAVLRARGDAVVLLPAPWRIEPAMIARCATVLDENPEVGTVLPALRLHAADGLPLRAVTIQPTLSNLVASPLATPPVVMIRRRLWERLNGLDEGAGSLAWCEWWLRSVAAGIPVAVLEDPLASLVASDRDWWPPLSNGPLDLARYRAVLEKHRRLVDDQMTNLVVEQEIAFGRLLARHREELRNRDRLLAELERARADAAHHHAYLNHHGRLTVEWGDLRRVDPISRDWGYDRGTPIDRRYIEEFLAAHSSDVSGFVLEVQEDDFTRRFGGPRVARSDVVDIDDANPRATLVTDLRAAVAVSEAQFDCLILTQTLHVIDDMPAAIGECHRILKPGGVLLATLPSASRVCLEYGEDGDLWRLTPAGSRALFERAFGPDNVEVTAYGSVLTNVAFLHGFACAELTDQEFESTDPYHPVLVGVRARKQPRSNRSARPHPAVVLLYHRVDEQPDVHDLAVPVALLEEQLGWLSRECHVMPLEQLLTDARDSLPERAVAITFDDGYLDTLESAAPLVERMGLSATVFATSRWLQEHGEYWWDVLERALLQGEPPRELTLDLRQAPLRFSTATLEERRAAHDLLHVCLVHASLDDRDHVLSQVVHWSGHTADRRRRPLLAEELQRLARVPGMSVGAHGVNHLALPDQAPDAQRSELLDSVRALERVLPRRVETFAFPYGAIDRASADLARATCRWSMGCDPAPVGPSFDAARVPRLEVKRWDSGTFRQHIERVIRRSLKTAAL